MSNPVYGLMVKRRLYQCDVCQTEHLISTNHTGTCWPSCPNCSWRSGYDSTGKHYRADTGKQRPQHYVGIDPADYEKNPHAPCNHPIKETPKDCVAVDIIG